MDARTAQILDALDAGGVSLLAELVAGPATEAVLIQAVGEAGQPTTNRKLERLRRAGLVEHEPGKPKAPGRRWSLSHTSETEAVLTALLALSDAVDVADRERRERAKRRLRRARARRLGIREAGGGGRV